MINFAVQKQLIFMDNVMYFIWLIAAYLLGSVSSAVWIARSHGINIREYGSGNAGATNVLRVLGPKAALPVFIFDFLKGLAAVQLVRFTSLTTSENPEIYTGIEITLGICAVIGHIFPVFASFKGGKGVATIAGALVAISPLPMLMALAVFVITLLITHYVSLSSIMAAIFFPIFVIFLFGMALSPGKITLTLKCFSLIASIMIILTHRKNIKRLKNGTENKISFKKKNSTDT
ncbi:MAG: glycerol-3-phosphate 1-O-acyltransferase PlsY [Prevotellaceae bacterium]|jgi:glycerol-3-phosphate acyltransferase PlsY|nr:glycerol-3-phosphate 1-O-acyltransferase PlsY [Prevotellaceae bacterium]